MSTEAEGGTVARTGLDLTEIATRLSKAPTIDELPRIIDMSAALPPNPPEAIQTQFVGLSYLDAFNEAGTFVTIVDAWAAKHRQVSLSGTKRVVDFGSGWGRITRMLLTQLPPTAIHALDVDPQMTALVNTTLPGVNTMTVNPMPPTVFGEASVEMALAFSVFSHLAPQAHDAWAAEFGRIVEPGGMVCFTVLDEVFLSQVGAAETAVAKGRADAFSAGLAGLFDDIRATTAAYRKGVPAYAGSGGGGVRTGDYYGWAAIPKSHVTRVWGEAGFEVVEWVRSGVLFPQAMVGMVRRDGSSTSRVRGLASRFGKR